MKGIGWIWKSITEAVSSPYQAQFVSFLLPSSLVAQLVKNPPAMQETPVCFLGRENPLEKGMATCTSILGLPLWLSW